MTASVGWVYAELVIISREHAAFNSAPTVHAVGPTRAEAGQSVTFVGVGNGVTEYFRLSLDPWRACLELHEPEPIGSAGRAHLRVIPAPHGGTAGSVDADLPARQGHMCVSILYRSGFSFYVTTSPGQRWTASAQPLQ